MLISEPTFVTNPKGETVVTTKLEFLEQNLNGSRIRALNKAFEVIKIDFPEIVGGTVYGSVANGYVHTNSDVDMTIFVDVSNNGLDDNATDCTLEAGGGLNSSVI